MTEHKICDACQLREAVMRIKIENMGQSQTVAEGYYCTHCVKKVCAAMDLELITNPQDDGPNVFDAPYGGGEIEKMS